ncbi:MAG: diguanylate cyclase [Pseudomonadota bacterium]
MPLTGSKRLLASACALRPRPGAATLVAVLSALLLPASVQALDPEKQIHHYFTDTWGLQDGLPQTQVTALAQGARGYLWVGTRGGLARFDGVRFRSFTPQTTPELTGAIIRDLHRDRHGRLWVATYKGLSVYADEVFGALHLALPDTAANTTFDARAIAEQDDGALLVATDLGLLQTAGDRLQPWSDAREPVHAVMTRGAEVWVGGVGRVWRMDADAPATMLHLPDDFATATVTSLLEYEGAVWAGTNRGVIRLDDAGWRRVFNAEQPVTNPVTAMHVDGDGMLWVATDERLLRFFNGALVADSPGAPTYPAIRAFTEDHEGSLWLGDHTLSVVRVRNGLTKRFSERHGLVERGIWSVAGDPLRSDALWVGTLQGLYYFVGDRFDLIAPPQALPHPEIYTLFPEGDRVWLGTRGGGVALWQDGEISIPAGMQYLVDAKVTGILREPDGPLWIASSKGVCAYLAAELTCHGREAGLGNPWVRVLHLSSRGELLVGSQQGLFRLVDGRFEQVASELVPLSEDITSISELSDGTLVVGSLSSHVYLRRQGEWYAYGMEDGLPELTPFFAARDQSRFLWLAGLRGLYRIPFAQFSAYERGAVDSLQGQMLLTERGDVLGSDKAYCCNGAGRAKGVYRDGVLWLPTRDGVIAVDSERVQSNPHQPEVVVEQVDAGEGWRDFSRGGAVELAPGNRNLSLRFTGLSFAAPQSVRFRYRMRGFDTAWRRPGDKALRTAFYTNLPPGRYTFEVTAANNAGVWREQPTSVDVHVRPQFYETRWFGLSLVLAVLGLIGLGLRLLLDGQRRQRARLRALVQARTQELQEANRHLREYSRRLESASSTDPLTGLWNRRYLDDQLPIDLSVLERKLESDPHSGLVTVFAVVDLDHFKALNDHYGHGAGDQVLREFAALVSALVRESDYVVRWGGEEFVIVLRDVLPADAQRTLQRLCQAVADHPFDLMSHGDEPLRVTCSIGFACYPFVPIGENTLTWERTIEVADVALYMAKRAGRNRVHGLLAGADVSDGVSIKQMRAQTKSLIESGALRHLELANPKRPPAEHHH